MPSHPRAAPQLRPLCSYRNLPLPSPSSVPPRPRTMAWEILHVPEEPPSSTDLSTVDVIAAKIEPKLANTLVRKLCQIRPLENLRHVKRVRRTNIEGNTELSVILCALGDEKSPEEVPGDVVQLVNSYQLSCFTAKVAKSAATSKEEWEEQCKLWPTSYHPPSNQDSVSGFNDMESDSICAYMRMAIQLTKLSCRANKVVNGAVIVDPLSGQVVAKATDQICLSHTCVKESGSKDCCAENESNELTTDEKSFPPETLLSGSSHSCKEVGCLNPWGWVEGPNSKNSLTCASDFLWHPLRHAALVAIENAAARDGQLFPASDNLLNSFNFNADSEQCTENGPVKRLKTEMTESDENFVKEHCNGELSVEAPRPYLCTGFDIYLVWEPCTMCAMALVHQRIRRVFYAFSNPNAGALGSVYRLQGERSLNHHYSVFRILVPDKTPAI